VKDNFEKLGDVAGGMVAGMSACRAVETRVPSSRKEWLSDRRSTIGASELPALFGVHAHMTPFELFAIKSGQYRREFREADIRENSIHLPPTERGNALEPVAFELLRRLRPTWSVIPNQIPGGQVFVDTLSRMSSTPDAFLIDPTREGRGSFQVKSMASSIFDRDWKPNGEPEPPVAVAIQAIADATLSDCRWACAGAIVAGYGIDLYLFDIPLHASLMAKARGLVADFWDRIEDERPYPPDFARDGAAIAAIYADDDGTEINLASSNRITEVVARREELKAIETAGSAAEKERKLLDDELRFALGNATRGRLADGRIVEAKVVKRRGFTVEPSQSRPVKIRESKSA
jgi:hypothetical protein